MSLLARRGTARLRHDAVRRPGRLLRLCKPLRKPQPLRVQQLPAPAYLVVSGEALAIASTTRSTFRSTSAQASAQCAPPRARSACGTDFASRMGDTRIDAAGCGARLFRVQGRIIPSRVTLGIGTSPEARPILLAATWAGKARAFALVSLRSCLPDMGPAGPLRRNPTARSSARQRFVSGASCQTARDQAPPS